MEPKMSRQQSKRLPAGTSYAQAEKSQIRGFAQSDTLTIDNTGPNKGLLV